MKIVSIDAAHSDEKKLTLRIEPPLTEPPFNHWSSVLGKVANARGQSGLFVGFNYSMMDGCLVIQQTLPIGKLEVTPSMVETIKDALDGIVQAENASQEYAIEQEVLAEAEKYKALQAVAKTFGVPVR